jgi:hypothetical protein
MIIFLTAIFIVEELFKVLESEYLSSTLTAQIAMLHMKHTRKGEEFRLSNSQKVGSIFHSLIDLVYFGFLIYCMGWGHNAVIILAAMWVFMQSFAFHSIYKRIFWANLDDPVRLNGRMAVAYRIDSAVSLIAMNVLLIGLLK